MNIKIDSVYNPFTYDEMMKPLLQYKEVEDQNKAKFEDLASQAEAFADLATAEENPEAFGLYNSFMSKFNSAADEFYKYGNTTRTGKALLNLNRNYSKEIGAIKRAKEEMDKVEEFRLKAGTDAIFQNDNYKLDDFLHGKKFNNKYQSYSEIERMSSSLTEATMKEAFNSIELKKYLENDAFLLSIQHNGGSYEDLMNALKGTISDDSEAQKRFHEIQQNVRKKVGYDNFGNDGKRRIDQAIEMGMYNGLDKPVMNLINRPDWLSPKDKFTMNLQSRSAKLAEEEHNAKMTSYGYVKRDDGTWVFDEELYKRIKGKKSSGNGSSSGSGSSRRNTMNNSITTVGVTMSTDKNGNTTSKGSYRTTDMYDPNKVMPGSTHVSYDYLRRMKEENWPGIGEIQLFVKNRIKEEDADLYDIYISQVDYDKKVDDDKKIENRYKKAGKSKNVSDALNEEKNEAKFRSDKTHSWRVQIINKKSELYGSDDEDDDSTDSNDAVQNYVTDNI